MAIDPETQQRLFDLVYDLLPDDEADELRRRIESDTELAAAYAEAQQTSRLFAEAARVETPKIPMKRPPRAPAAPRPARPKPDKPGPPRPAPWSRIANWTIALAAGVLLLISIGGFFYQRQQLRDIAADHLRLRVSGPAELHAGVANRYLINTTSVTGTPLPAKIQFTVFTPLGKQVMGHIEKTDDRGRLEVTIPADLDLKQGATLEVLADADQRRESLVTRLNDEPVRYATQLSLDKPLYQPGETIRYRSLTLSRFGLAADRQVPVHFEIVDPGGAAVPGSELEGVTDRGVGCGEFEVPAGLAGGEYTLVARSLDGSFPEERRAFFIRSYRLPRLKKELEFARDSYPPGGNVVADFSAERAEGGPAANAELRVVARVDGEVVYEQSAEASPSGTYAVEFTLPEKITRGDGQLAVIVDDGGTQETIAKTIPINLGKVDVAFYPEGGDLVAGLRNRVYFTARDPLGKPVELTGRIVDAKGTGVALAETTHEGMGAFTFEPQAAGKYRLLIDEPADAKNEPKLPAVSSHRKVVLNTGLGVIEAGEPLEFNVRSVEAGLPLVASAWCRGAPVGEQPLITDLGSNPVAIELDPQASGTIRLTIFDYSTSPPEPIAERLVYRRPSRRVQVRVAEHSERYSPGEHAKVALIATDEEDKPIAATLGVAVVDDALLSLADDDTPQMPTHFLLTTEIENPEDLEDADFYLSDDPEAPVALDLLLGTQGWRRFTEKTLDQLRKEGREDKNIERLVALGGEANPPAMFDNMAELEKQYRTDLAAYRVNRTRTLDAMTALSFFGGLALLLFVAMVALLKIATGVRVWVPGVAAAAACLTIGLVLMNPKEPQGGRNDTVAFAGFDMAPPEPVAADKNKSEVVRELGEMEPRDFFAAETPAPMAAPAAAPEDMPADALDFDDMGAAAAGPPVVGEPLAKRERAAVGLAEAELADKFVGLDEKQRRVAGLAMKPKGMGRKPMGFGQALGGRLLEPQDEDLSQFRFVVREYSHEHVKGQPGVRSDFAETLYWNPMLVTDGDGRAEIEFDLSDSVTTFRVTADAHADGGRIGSGTGELVSRMPFSLEPKLPLQVTAGDRIDLPLAVVNDTAGELDVKLALEHGKLVELDGPAERTLALAADGRGREYFPLKVTGQKGNCKLLFRGSAGSLGDAVEKRLSVVPPGFPVALSYSGQLDGDQEVVVRLPEDWVPGSLEVALNVFPSTLADLQQGMDSMLREPCGCFEQASSSNYPNVLSLDYMQNHDVADPDVTRRAKTLLDKGYAKLVGYESPDKGYEWFGGDPGHEALTAYGLMEFRDMARVFDVDPEMLKRTAAWLMDRRDGKGGFERNPRALDSFGAAPQDITDAYITWALSESGQEGIEKEIEHAAQLATDSDDPYLVALAAASLLNVDKESDAEKLLDKLSKAQADDGMLEGKGSITRSGGLSLKVETTALAALAWLKSPAYAHQADRAVQWIVDNRQGSGGFGSTQATILALKAMIEHSKANRRTVSDGKLIVKRDGKVIAEETFLAGRQEAISLEGLAADLTPDENRLTLTLTDDNQLPYALDVSYRSQKPASDDACSVRLSTSLAEAKVKAGDTVALTAELTNTTDEGQPMTVAILGLPAGLEVRPDQLDELKQAGTIDYYETRPREVICYWRSLAPKKSVQLTLDLIAAVPGVYTGPASRAYLYYTADRKQWTNPLSIEITRD